MEELQVVTTLAVSQHIIKSVVDLKDSLGDFSETVTKTRTSNPISNKKKVVIVSAPSQREPVNLAPP
jgi:hypothetical protein